MQFQIFRRSRCVLLLALVTLALGASAQTWPDRPIKLVVPFPPGGGADMAARTYGEKLSALLGQPVLIDNKPGASGNIGAEQVARAPADGYTLLFANEFLATNPLMFKEIRYDSLKDFVPIAKVASNAAAIAVPDPTYREVVCAVIVRREGSRVTADEIVAHCTAHMASYKKPRHVTFVDALPRTPSQKIQKFKLREQFAHLGSE